MVQIVQACDSPLVSKQIFEVKYLIIGQTTNDKLYSFQLQ